MSVLCGVQKFSLWYSTSDGLPRLKRTLGTHGRAQLSSRSAIIRARRHTTLSDVRVTDYLQIQ